jgi:hypothetical protein
MTAHLAAAGASCMLLLLTGSAIASQDVAGSDQALRAFVEYTDRKSSGEAHQQAITVKSLTLLADAVASLAQRNGLATRLDGDVATLRQHISDYQTGRSGEVAQSARLRRTLIHAGALIRRLLVEAKKDARPRDARLNALQRAAESLDDRQLLRRQPDVIENFFRHAAQALLRFDR